jgi:hypothetical protein
MKKCTLFDTQMGIDGGITSCSCEVFALPVGDVLAIPLDVALGKSKIKEENFIGSFIVSNTEVIGFNVTMNEVTIMHVLNSSDHLVNQHQHGFEGEFSEGLVEEGLQGWAHQIHDKNIVIT